MIKNAGTGAGIFGFTTSLTQTLSPRRELCYSRDFGKTSAGISRPVRNGSQL